MFVCRSVGAVFRRLFVCWQGFDLSFHEKLVTFFGVLGERIKYPLNEL